MKAHGLEINEDLTVYGYYVADSAKYHVPTFWVRVLLRSSAAMT